jgi:transposase
MPAALAQLVPNGPREDASGPGAPRLAERAQAAAGQARDIESSIRGILRGFGLKVGAVSKGTFEARIRALMAGRTMLERVTEPLLRARAALGAEYATSHRHLLATVRQDEVCRRLMTVPEVGAVVAVTFRSGIDQPNASSGRRRSPPASA